jgi:2'-5' RNA ligase
MAKLAIDVVLLPDSQTTDKIIDINRNKLRGENNDNIILNNSDCLPHISLCMGVIENEKLMDINGVLKEIAFNHSYFKVEAIGINEKTINDNEIISSITVKKIKELQSLHDEIMKAMRSFITYDANKDMIQGDFYNIDDRTVEWINNYHTKSAYDKFNPHVTIGFGTVKDIQFPFTFVCPRLAVCYLGDFCTCNKIILDIYFKKSMDLLDRHD